MKLRAGPDGIHLFNRMTGTNLLIDEVKVPKEMWSKAPRQISMALTNACDLRCPFCYAPKNPANLEFDIAKRWISELDTNGAFGIGFGGGEPTLHPYFPELCKYTTNHTNLAVSFTTHAHHLHDALLSKLIGNVHFVRVSMDGLNGTYERLRGKSFSDLSSQLAKVAKLAAFGINFVVNADTIEDLDLAADFSLKAGASELLLLPERPVNGRGGIDNKTRSRLVEWVFLNERKIPLTISQGQHHGMPTCDALKQEIGLMSYCHIDASGVLKRTSFDKLGIQIASESVMNSLEILSRLPEKSI